jgi:hypothetical protein
MRVQVQLASPRDGEWYVISEGTYLVGFSGVHAHELALQQLAELSKLLNAVVGEAGFDQDRPSSTFSDD